MSKTTTTTIILALCLSGIIGGVIGSILTQGVVYANSNPNTITARSVNILDKAGKSRIGLGFEDGQPFLYLADENGKVKAYWALTDKGPLMVFRDQQEKMQLFISSKDNGASLIGPMAGRNEHRLGLAYLPEKGAAISLFDENKVPKLFISTHHGNPSVTLLDRDKKPAIAMFNKKGRGSYLSIWNSNNDPSVSLAVQGDKPGLFMYQQPRTGLLFNMAGGRPALALMDHGSPIWSATGDVPPAPELPPMDDMMRELTR